MLYCLPELFASWFQKIFQVFFFKYVRVYGSKWPPRHGQFGPQGHGWQDFMQGITKHWYIHNILDVGLMVLESYFSIYSQWTIMTPRVWTNFDPRGMVGTTYVWDHWTLLYIKYISCRPELKWRELWWLAHLSNFLCLWELYVAHGPWQLEFQSSQPQNLMHPYASFSLPYVLYMKFDHTSRYILLWKCQQTMTTDHQYTH